MGIAKQEAQFEAIQKATADMKKAAVTMSTQQARYLVDIYYTIQNQRIRAANAGRAMDESNEPHTLIDWYYTQSRTIENNIKSAPGIYADSKPLGRWSRSVVGVGPVIAAGLLAHIDVERPSVGSIWRFAGLDPTCKWEKGKKRPWNASLKVLCWKMAESFVKVQANENDHYGKMYANYKQGLIAKNECGEFAESCKEILASKKWRGDTKAKKCYEDGKLPPAHIHARAERWIAKMFLSHYHVVGFWLAKGVLPSVPYILTQDGHSHYNHPPNMGLVPGLEDAISAIIMD